MCFTMTENLSRALKGELIPEIINITDVQILIVGVGSPSGKYFSHFMHFDFQPWERTVGTSDSQAAQAPRLNL